MTTDMSGASGASPDGLQVAKNLEEEGKQLAALYQSRTVYIAQAADMAVAAREIGNAIGDTVVAHQDAQKALEKLAASADETNRSMGDMVKTGLGVVDKVIEPVLKATQVMYEASAAGERLSAKLNFANVGAGASEIVYLRDLTQQLGLEFNSTAQAYLGFQGAARGTAMEGQNARDVFESVAKAGAAMGLSVGESEKLLKTFQDALAGGSAQLGKLSEELEGRMPGAFRAAAQAMGYTSDGLREMLSQGKVVAEDFLPQFAQALEKSLGEDAPKAADRLDGAVNRLGNAWERLKQNGGDSGVSSFAAGQYAILSDAMDDVSVSMELARAKGGGFTSQLAAAAGATLEFLNPLNAFSYSAGETSNRLKEAEQHLKELEDAGAGNGRGSLMMRQMHSAAVAAVKELPELKKAQDEALGAKEVERVVGGGAGRGSVNPKTAGTLSQEEAERKVYLSDDSRQTKDQARAEEISKARERNAALVEKAEGNVNAQLQLRAALEVELGNINEKYKRGTTQRAGNERSEYEAVVSSLQAKIAVEQGGVVVEERLSESQRKRKDYLDGLQESLGKLTPKERENAQALILQLQTLGKSNDAQRDYIKAAEEASKAEAKVLEDRQKSGEAVEKQVEKLQEEQKANSYAAAQNISLAQAIEEVNLARLRGEQTRLLGEGADGATLLAIQREIEARERLIGLIKNKDAGEKDKKTAAEAEAATKDAAKKAQEQWKATADSINKGLTDAFMKSLESGKDFGKNLANALKEQFKSLVLKPTINAILSPISGGLASAFGMVNSGAGAAVQAVTGGGGGSGLGTLASGASLLGSVGGAFSSGFSMTLAGGLGTALEGGLAMLGSSTGLSSALAGIGQIAGALGPIGLAVAALLAISKTTKGETRTGGQFGIAYEGSVTNQRRGQTYTYEGQQYDRDFSNGERKALVNGQAYRLEGDPVSDESTIKKAIAGTATSINDLLRMYGSRSTLTSFSAGFETSGKSRGGVFAGGILSTGERFGESGQGDNYSQTLYELTSTNSPDYKTAVENFTTDLQQATLQALKAATDLPKYVSRQLKDVDIEALGATETTALLSKIGDLPNQLLQSFGTSRDALVQQFAQGLAGGDAAAAGEAVANTLVASIEQTLFTTAAGRIFDTVNAGIIAPMLDAITTGANISEVLSQESIDRTIARAQEQAEAVTLLFNSPDFVAAMERIRTTVGGALGQAGSGVNYTPRYQPVTVAATQSTGELGNAASELGNAVSELVQQFNSAVSSLSSDAKSLQIDLLRAQGKKSEADALERDNYLNPFEKLSASDRATLATQYDVNAATRRAIDAQNERNGLQDELNSLTDDATQALTRQRDALDESNRALFDNVQAIKLQKTIADELPGVVDKYLSPAQRRQSQYDQVTADLNAVGIKVSSEQLMGLSRAQIGSAAMDIYNTAGVPDEARLAVVRAAGALADLKNADVDTAFAALERAVDAQRKVLDEAITELTSVFETARDAAKTLFGEVESAVQFQGDEGRAFISNALAVAQSTGYLPDSEKFSKAVSDATGALGQQMFATQAESDYQRLVLANELKSLQDISGDQLDKAKDELEYLDEQLAEQRKQIDVLNGIDLSVQSVEGAISALGTAMNGARSATTLGGSGLAAYDKELGVGRNSAGTLFQRDDIRLAASNALEAGANPRDIYNVIKGSGFTLAQAGVILGTEPGSLEDFAREMNWPVFHRGTRRVPRTGFALLQQGEAVIPAAYNPFAAGRGWGNSKDMLAAMEGVRAELIEVRRQNDALQRAAMRTADAVNGRPEAPMLVESV